MAILSMSKVGQSIRIRGICGYFVKGVSTYALVMLHSADTLSKGIFVSATATEYIHG